ncbi:MAG: transglycosylase SLT domain-containing protein [Sulfurifustis sp.]
MRGKWARKFWAAPLSIRLLGVAGAAFVIWLVVNWMYQVARKPAELFFPVSDVLYKTPAETWRKYEPIFRAHSTAVITPELLAALAQVESTGNPIARTYWRWAATWQPFEVYRPASSAVGMYQITDATFLEAKRYCVHDHIVAEDGPWNDFDSCWFNNFYLRVVPSHAVELTSALLDRRVASALERARVQTGTLAQKQDLAAVIHLCGAAAGEAYARRGFRIVTGQRCGDHDLARYLARVNAMKRFFARLNPVEPGK